MLSTQVEEIKEAALFTTGQYDTECITHVSLKNHNLESLESLALFKYLTHLDLFTSLIHFFFHFYLSQDHVIGSHL